MARWVWIVALVSCSSGSAGHPDAAPDDAAAVSPDATLTPDVAFSADATIGQTCTFNADCAPSERCACAAGACACELGARGAISPGAGPCTSGDDCASALCLEGPGGGLLCSGECTSERDCPSNLPRCLTVPTVGTFCARDLGASGADAGVAGCTGACASTTLRATFGPRVGDFSRAQHGRAGAIGIRIEAHFGGDPECPDQNSPTPDRTLVLSGLSAEDRTQTEADGVRASLLDFRGDLTAAPVLRATTIRVTPRGLEPGAWVSFSVEATFVEGTIAGGVYAPHCPSLDE